MVKRGFAVGMAVLLVCLAAVGCGIPQEEHDAVVAERDTGLAKVASLESDLAATETELETTENILGETEDDLAATQSDLAATQTELADAESQISSLRSAANKAKSDLAAVQGDYEAASTELADIKELYPPRDFSSLRELEDWLAENDVSERSASQYVETLYGKALQIQEDALKDGYIISVNVYYDESDGLYYVSCVAVIDGELWVWSPETDEPINYSQVADWQKVK